METDADTETDDFTDIDLCEVACQLDHAIAYIDVVDPAGDDLIVPATVLCDILAWMLDTYDDPDNNVGQVEILRRMADAFRFIFGAEYGELPAEVEAAKDQVIAVLRCLETECNKQKMN